MNAASDYGLLRGGHAYGDQTQCCALDEDRGGGGDEENRFCALGLGERLEPWVGGEEQRDGPP
jgi:hypothetical protein